MPTLTVPQKQNLAVLSSAIDAAIEASLTSGDDNLEQLFSIKTAIESLNGVTTGSELIVGGNLHPSMKAVGEFLSSDTAKLVDCNKEKDALLTLYSACQSAGASTAAGTTAAMMQAQVATTGPTAPTMTATMSAAMMQRMARQRTAMAAAAAALGDPTATAMADPYAVGRSPYSGYAGGGSGQGQGAGGTSQASVAAPAPAPAPAVATTGLASLVAGTAMATEVGAMQAAMEATATTDCSGPTAPEYDPTALAAGGYLMPMVFFADDRSAAAQTSSVHTAARIYEKLGEVGYDPDQMKSVYAAFVDEGASADALSGALNAVIVNGDDYPADFLKFAKSEIQELSFSSRYGMS